MPDACAAPRHDGDLEEVLMATSRVLPRPLTADVEWIELRSSRATCSLRTMQVKLRLPIPR